MILTVAAQKGGTGKTSSSAAIAQALDSMGRKALLVDADSQGSASLIYGAEPSPGLYGAIMGDEEAADLVQHCKPGDILPSNSKLDRLDIELNNQPGRDAMLSEALKPLESVYDTIIIDTAPGMGTVLIQSLAAADKIIIPLQADPHSLRGLHQIAETIEQVKRFVKPDLEVAGVFITQYSGRPTLTRQYDELIRQHCRDLGIPFAETHIRRAVAIQEAQALRESLYQYAPKSNPAVDYMNLIEELSI